LEFGRTLTFSRASPSSSGRQRLLTSRDGLRLAPDSEMLAVKLRWTFRPLALGIRLPGE